MMRRALLAAILVHFSACAAKMEIDDNITKATLFEAKQGVAIFQFQVGSAWCQNAHVYLGKPVNDGYEITELVRAGQGNITNHNIVQASLPAGEHHVIGLSCFENYTHRSTQWVLGINPLKGEGTTRTSIASFSLAPGEIVNLGLLNLRRSDPTSLVVQVEVKELTTEMRDRFAKEKPKLASQMITRHFKVSRQPLSMAPIVPGAPAALCEAYKHEKDAPNPATVPMACQKKLPLPVAKQNRD